MNFPMETKIVGLVKTSSEDGYIYGEDKNYIIPDGKFYHKHKTCN